MGYWVTSTKINVLLDKFQQNEIYAILSNPPNLDNSLSNLMLHNYKYHVLELLKYQNSSKQVSLKEMLTEIGFSFIEQKNGLKLTGFQNKWSYQLEVIKLIGNSLTVGNYIKLRGEDGARYGFVFNGNAQVFNSDKEFKELMEKIELNKKLQRTLKKETTSKNKIIPKL